MARESDANASPNRSAWGARSGRNAAITPSRPMKHSASGAAPPRPRDAVSPPNPIKSLRLHPPLQGSRSATLARADRRRMQYPTAKRPFDQM